METNEIKKSNSLRYQLVKTYTKGGTTYKAKINVRLNDECKNGHQDFAVTVDQYRKGKNEQWYEDSFGCQHDLVLELAPELKPFVDLHLCDYNGAPMYALENGYYHFEKKDKPEVAKEYLRITNDEYTKLSEAPDKIYFGYLLKTLGVVERWKREASEAIKLLEALTGQQFVNDSTRSQFTPPSKEEIEAVKQKINEGYYTPDAIKTRQDQKEKEKREKIANDLLDTMNETIQKARTEYYIKMAIHNAGLPLDNFIFYNHTAEGVFNWNDSPYNSKISRPQFDTFLSSDFSKVIDDNGNYIPVTWKIKNA